MRILDKAKAAAEQAATKAKEGVEEVQTKRDLHAAQTELGEQVFGLVEAGELELPAAAELVERIRGLKAKLDEEGDGAAPAPPASPSGQPPAMPT